MYANTASKKVKGNETLEQLITSEVSQFKKNHSAVKIIDAPPLTTHDEKQAIVKEFLYSQHETVAYIDEENIVAMLVLTAQTDEEFAKALPAFKELVSSYFFMTGDFHIQE